MAVTTITGRPAVLAGNLNGSVVTIVDDANGNSRKMTLAQLRTNLFAGSTGYASGDPLAVNAIAIQTGTALTFSNAVGTQIGTWSGSSGVLTLNFGLTVSAGGITVNAGTAGFAGGIQITANVGAPVGGLGKSAGIGLVVAGVTGSTDDMALLNGGGGTVMSIPTGTTTTKLYGALQLGIAYVGGAPAATGYVTLKDSTGTTYKVLVST